MTNQHTTTTWATIPANTFYGVSEAREATLNDGTVITIIRRTETGRWAATDAQTKDGQSIWLGRATHARCKTPEAALLSARKVIDTR